MQRRTLLQALLVTAVVPTASFAKSSQPVIEVYKSATCGCCTQWVEHLQKSGFKVNPHNVPNTAAYRDKFGVPPQLGSCHTATIGGYVLEGHVPADDIKRLLTEKSKAKGLAVSGMPMGSPGMEQAGGLRDAYDVLLFRTDGTSSVYRHYAARKAD